VSPEDAEIDPAGRLMPAPWALVLPGGDGVPSAVGFDPRFAAAETPRLRRAVERFAAICGSRRGGPTRPLVVECERASPPWPAVDDDEGYELVIDRSGVRLAAAAEWGVLRGLATLAQLCSAGAAVPALRIVDQPRFPWRGLMLDVARHFIPLPDLLRTLDGMAIFKLNVLHLHLSDDQGFRFGSRRYPELASADHYSRDELSELVAAAADRGIRIVPELDVPGHTASWLAAHPEWGCGTPRPTRRFGVHDECLDPTRPAVMAAVTGLFEELAEVFPDRYLHLGGDEVRADWWQSDPAVAAYMARHGLADAAALQSRFTADVAAAIAGLGRRALAWDEVLHPGLPSGLTVQAWRGVTARERALAAGCDCVLSAPYYLDLFYPADVHAGFDPAASLSELMTRETRCSTTRASPTWRPAWPGPGAGVSSPSCRRATTVPGVCSAPRPACGPSWWTPGCWTCGCGAACRPWRSGSGVPVPVISTTCYRRLEHALAALPDGPASTSPATSGAWSWRPAWRCLAAADRAARAGEVVRAPARRGSAGGAPPGPGDAQGPALRRGHATRSGWWTRCPRRAWRRADWRCCSGRNVRVTKTPGRVCGPWRKPGGNCRNPVRVLGSSRRWPGACASSVGC
jgi:hypothetical protein